MVNCVKNQAQNGACYSQTCQHLPLDSVFSKHFNDVRGGGKKRSRKMKGGSINYILDVGKPPIGGLSEVARHTTQPLYVDGKIMPGKDACGGGRRKKRATKGKRSNLKYFNKTIF